MFKNIVDIFKKILSNQRLLNQLNLPLICNFKIITIKLYVSQTD